MSHCQVISADRAEELARRQRKPRISYDAFETKRAGAPPAMFHESLPDRSAPLWDGWATEVVLLALEEGCITIGRARELLTWS